jgi:hypothetical protein
VVALEAALVEGEVVEGEEGVVVRVMAGASGLEVVLVGAEVVEGEVVEA